MAADIPASGVTFHTEDAASPLNVLKPAAFASGDRLIFILTQDGSDVTAMTAPSGWSVLGNYSASNQGKAFYHDYNAGDPSSWDFPYEGGADVAGSLIRVTGADLTATPVIQTGASGPSGGTVSSPSATPAGSDDLMIVALGVFAAGNTLVETDPTGTTDQGQGQLLTFQAVAVASKQLSSGSATGTQAWTSITPANANGGTFTILVKSASAGGASATAQPVIVTPPAAGQQRATPVIVRGSLADIDVRAVAVQPVVVQPPTRRPQPAYVLVTGAPLAPASTGAPLPLVVQPLAAPRPAPPPATVVRGSLLDVDVRALAVQPLLVQPLPTPPRPPFVLIAAAPQPPATGGAPAPLMVQPATLPRPAQPPATVVRGSLVDLDVRAAPTQPYLVAQQPQRTAAPYLYIGAAPVADTPAGSPPPVIVLPDPRRPRPADQVVVRAPMPPQGAPAPLIVQPAAKAPAPAPAPIVITSAPQAPPAAAAGGAPAPWVVLPAAPSRPPAFQLVAQAPLSTVCIVTRPNTGTVARGATGTVTRPYTGIVEHCSCCT